MLAKSRAKATNGSLLPGVDGRSASARRFRDLVANYTAELGGSLSEADLSLVKQVVALQMKAETMQAAIVLGKEVDSDQLIRITGTARRMLATIGTKAKAKTPSQDLLAAHIAAKYGNDAADDEVAAAAE